MAACLCRHMKEALFSDTTAVMAEKDRKSYFKTTRRLLGECGYAQNLALFYILYVRKKVSGTAESLSAHCPCWQRKKPLKVTKLNEQQCPKCPSSAWKAMVAYEHRGHFCWSPLKVRFNADGSVRVTTTEINRAMHHKSM